MSTIEQKFRNEIEIERMRAALKQGEYLEFYILPWIILLIFILWNKAPHQLLFAWFLLLTIISFLRWIALRTYHKMKTIQIADVQNFKLVLLIGTLVNGIALGIGNIWFLEPSEPISIMIMSLFTMLIGSGTILTYFLLAPDEN